MFKIFIGINFQLNHKMFNQAQKFFYFFGLGNIGK